MPYKDRIKQLEYFRDYHKENKGKINYSCKKQCIVCGNVFFERPSHIDKRKHCSKECYIKSMIGSRLSEQHRKNIGIANIGRIFSEQTKRKISIANDKGKTSANIKARTSLDYKKWRIKIFERDNYTCQECGASGVYLQAHHIKSFAFYKEQRLKLDNGKTLCKECHRETDNYKGKAHKCLM